MTGIEKRIHSPFVRASAEVILPLFCDSCSGEEKFEGDDTDVAVIVGVTGALTGKVIVKMQKSDVMRHVRDMAENPPAGFNDVAMSAVGEIGNLIAGNATIELFENGYDCTITPPSVLVGKDIHFSRPDNLSSLEVNFRTADGEISLILFIDEPEKENKENP